MRSIICLISLFVFWRADAQQITYSAYEKFDVHNGDFSVVGKVGGKLYVYRSGSDGHFLDALDDSMQRIATVVLDFFPAKIYETRFIAYPDKMIVLYQGNERGKITQYAALLDATGRLQGKILTLDEARTGIFGPSGNYFSSAVSEDRKKIVVYDANTKGVTLQLTRILMNDNLERSQRMESAYTGENSLAALHGMVDNSGNFYLPVTTNTGGRGYADGLWILSLGQESRKFGIQEIPLQNAYATGLFFKVDNASKVIYGSGFYSQKKTGNYDGVLIAQLPADSNLKMTTRQLPFDDQLREASGRSRRRAFNDYQTRQLIVRTDGGFVLLAEDYYMAVRNGGIGPYGYYSSYYSPFIGTQNIREYHYGDILALSYNAAGDREWTSFIRKDQYSQEDGGIFSSYSFVNTGGSLGFLYNDFDSRRSRITLAAIASDGQIDTHALDAGGASNPDWLPRSGKQVSAHELLVPCLRRRQICFAKVVF